MTDAALRQMALECGAKHPKDWMIEEELRFTMSALQALALRIEAQAIKSEQQMKQSTVSAAASETEFMLCVGPKTYLVKGREIW